MFNNIFSKNIIKPLIIGFIISIVVSFLAIIIFAVTATNIDISDEGLTVMSIISMIIGAFAGGFVSAKVLKEKGLIIGAINGLLFFFIMTLISFIVSREPMSSISLIKILSFTIASMLGGIFGVNIKHKRSI